MGTQYDHTCLAFAGDRCLGSGGLREVVRLAKLFLDRHPDASVLIFDSKTAHQIEVDYRGTLEDVLARLPAAADSSPEAETGIMPPPRGPGRPKLGVVAREITLLPRHWEWLAGQRGGASVALRRLIDEARGASESRDRIRQGQEAAYRFISVMAGDKPHYEEAMRALFAGESARFGKLIAEWPGDVRERALEMAERAFGPASPAPAG